MALHFGKGRGPGHLDRLPQGSGSSPLPQFSVTMGALTLTGMGDAPVSGSLVSIVDNTSTAQTDLDLTAGVLTPTSTWQANCLARSPYTVTTSAGIYTVTALASTYHIGKNTDWAGVANVGGIGHLGAATLKGKTIRFRSGVRVNSQTTAGAGATEPLRRYVLWDGTNPLTMTSDDPDSLGGFVDPLYLSGATYIHFQQIYFTVPADPTTGAVSVGGPTSTLPGSDIWFDSCTLQGATVDPTADFSAGFPNGRGITTSGTFVSNIKATGCTVLYASRGIILNDNPVTTGAGLFCTNASPVIIGNKVDAFYQLGIQVSSCGLNSASNIIITDNVVTRPIGLATDTGNPHCDSILLSGAQASAIADVNVTVDRNEVLRGNARGQAATIAGRDLDLASFFYTGQCIGNVINEGSTDGLLWQNAKAMTVLNNTVTKRTGDTAGATLNIGVAAGGTTSGTHVIKSNICDSIAAGGTPTLANNVTLVTSGFTMDQVFTGPTFQADTPALVQTLLAPLPSGPADTAVAGIKPGAVASGAVNWAAANPSDTPGSNNVP